MAGTLRLGEVACSAASSDSPAAWGCVSLAGVSIADSAAALAFAQLQKLLAPGEIIWGPGQQLTTTSDSLATPQLAQSARGSSLGSSVRKPAHATIPLRGSGDATTPPWTMPHSLGASPREFTSSRPRRPRGLGRPCARGPLAPTAGCRGPPCRRRAARADRSGARSRAARGVRLGLGLGLGLGLA